MRGVLEYNPPIRLCPMIRTLRALDALQQIANQVEAGRLLVVRGDQNPWRPALIGALQHGVTCRAVRIPVLAGHLSHRCTNCG